MPNLLFTVCLYKSSQHRYHVYNFVIATFPVVAMCSSPYYSKTTSALSSTVKKLKDRDKFLPK